MARLAVPSVDAPFWPDVAEFAATYDGYRRHGDSAAVRQIAAVVCGDWWLRTGHEHTLDDHRAALFFEYRYWRWNQSDPPRGPRTRWIAHLLTAIDDLSGGAVEIDEPAEFYPFP